MPGGLVRVLVADDHALLRSGLRRLLAYETWLELVGEAADGRETAQLVEQLRPDVLLLDLHMPRTNGLDLIRRLRARCPATRIVVMTGYAETAALREALSAGVAGVLLKLSGSAAMIRAIASVHEGRLYVDPELRLEPPARPAEVLTVREREVLGMLASGASYREIASRLHIGERTVETYRRRIADKLGVKTRAELVGYALERGFLDVQCPPRT